MARWHRWPTLAILLLAAGLTGFVPGTATANSLAKAGGAYPQYPEIKTPADPALAARVKRGEYLVKLADCMACHTDTDTLGTPFAGGLKIDTPFGALYSPNITPDKDTGIGSWSDDDFVRAVREGIRPDGSYYYPVFPYNYFSKMSRADVLDIKAWLDQLPAVKQANKAQQMDWPFNYRFMQLGWRLLYFDFEPEGYQADNSQTAAWNRGAYIVEGPGHCALCHTELNLLGVPRSSYYLAGAFVEDYYAPDITRRGLAELKEPAVAAIFSADRKPGGAPLAGPMADVEHNSLRYLTSADALAVADYLKSVDSESPPIEDVSGTALAGDAGRKLYESSCKVCHAIDAIGAPEISSATAWDNLLAQGRERLYEIAIRGDGPMPARGGCPPCSDERLEAAVDYMIEQATQQHPSP